MSSPKQIAANKLNAEKSTGPKTSEGKATASKNSTKHAILSSKVCLDDDERLEFQDFHDRILQALQPADDGMELLLVDRIASSAWRLRRIITIESLLMTESEQIILLRESVAGYFTSNEGPLATLSRYEAGLERALYRALHELQRLQAARQGRAVPLPVAIDVHGDQPEN